MKILERNNQQSHVDLIIEFSPNEIQEQFEKSTKALAKEVKLPGFRKGKVPFAKAVSALNESDIWKKTVNLLVTVGANLVDDDNSEFTKDLFGEYIGVELQKLEPENKQVVLKYSFETVPKFEIGDYSKIETNIEFNKTVDEEQINQEIERLIGENTMLISSDNPATANDVVWFDFDGFLADKPLANASAKNHKLDLAKSEFIPGYAEELIGLKKGDTKSFTIKFPDEYHATELRAQNVRFDVTINDVKTKKTPEFNDEFVSTLSIQDVATVSQLKTHLEKQLSQRLLEENERNKINAISQWMFSDHNKVLSTPIKNLVKEAQKMLVEEKARDKKNKGFGLSALLKMMNWTEEQYLDQIVNRLYSQVAFSAFLNQIVQKEQITYTQEEKLAEIEKIKDTPQYKSVPQEELEEVLNQTVTQKKALNILTANLVYVPKQETQPSEPEQASN